ncbi:MAG: hypothetical protein RSB90_11435 [Eubacterium sp.]
MSDVNVSCVVNKLVQLKEEIALLNSEKAQYEAAILTEAENDLKDTKIKTIHYEGSDWHRVTVTQSSTVKVIYPSYLPAIFGDAYEDIVKEERVYKLAEPAKRMLSGLYLQEYTKLTIDEVIDSIEIDRMVKDTLKKKIKGAKFETDKKNLMEIAGLDEKNAETYAYFMMEAAVWSNFKKLMLAGGKDNPADIKRALELIDGAVLVDESMKIAVE